MSLADVSPFTFLPAPLSAVDLRQSLRPSRTPSAQFDADIQEHVPPEELAHRLPFHDHGLPYCPDGSYLQQYDVQDLWSCSCSRVYFDPAEGGFYHVEPKRDGDGEHLAVGPLALVPPIAICQLGDQLVHTSATEFSVTKDEPLLVLSSCLHGICAIQAQEVPREPPVLVTLPWVPTVPASQSTKRKRDSEQRVESTVAALPPSAKRRRRTRADTKQTASSTSCMSSSSSAPSPSSSFPSLPSSVPSPPSSVPSPPSSVPSPPSSVPSPPSSFPSPPRSIPSPPSSVPSTSSSASSSSSSTPSSSLSTPSSEPESSGPSPSSSAAPTLASSYSATPPFKPFNCDFAGCNEGIETAKEWVKHMEEVHGLSEKGWVEHTACPSGQCKTHYKTWGLFVRHHFSKHRGQKLQYDCPEPGCNIPQSRRDSLLRHVKRYHPERAPELNVQLGKKYRRTKAELAAAGEGSQPKKKGKAASKSAPKSKKGKKPR
ncbi:hypothetical protein L227DRAFT_614471 [Lentinus tigrinus ALCF2SS1-6]|uniref:C2H2-type domain-containing protein n=1 Tax=Lentinus tigrinus ALCF2SS1-6 TaxID=1328759 RepID=A0A5C2RZS3_9APHY|nr:hypothetical protein L227DRAFT_614471 [Lentinus tigrinus ALCF2SS1-6]